MEAMSFKTWFAKQWARRVRARVAREQKNALALQLRTFHRLVQRAAHTAFGRDHHFDLIRTYEQFRTHVPVRDYEAMRPWLDRVYGGEEDITWEGKPIYLAKTSGTTSGAKYIPLSRESMQNQVKAARDALLMHIANTGNAGFLGGKMMFLSGSPVLDTNAHGMKVGRLSGIVNHFVPAYLQRNRVPGFATNSIEDWEEKVTQIVKEIKGEDLRLISGIPPWVQMLFEELNRQTGKQPLEVWPNLQVFVQGGVNFQPYKPIFDAYFGDKVSLIETFPASEGFFAFQDTVQSIGMHLMPDNGIFFEFIPVEEYGRSDARRLWLGEVVAGQSYALIVSTNAGLWAYDIGDVVRFESVNPWRVRVVGRVKHFISAFGEHVIGEEVEYALMAAVEATGAEVAEFTVAPLVVEQKGESAHEWLIEFSKAPESLPAFSLALDNALRKKNVYYEDLRAGNILRQAVVTLLKPYATREYMKAEGKLGGQNKFPRLTNDRKVADALYPFRLKA